MTLGDIIYKYRSDRGLSMDKFSEISGISKGYISMLEKNKTARGDEPSPSFEMYKSVAKTIGISVDDLIRRVEGKISMVPDLPNIAPMPETERKPRVGRIACGDPIIAEENIEDYDEVLTSWYADFTLMCVGDSMAPKIENGDIVAIRAQPTIENGEIAAVRIGDEATLKRVFLHADYIELRPINPNYDSIIRSKSEMEDIRIEGRAVGLCRNLQK